MRRLVVVESPTKARTIRRFLPDEFHVEASMGHVRDLPSSASEIPAAIKKEEWARLGVNVQEGFEPLYVIPSSKKKVVRQLKKALKEADELLLATDEDREGESIGWHLTKVLDPKVPIRRMVFHEITSDAIRRALDETREIDNRLVDAQEARRILDRLVGYTVSPLLWKKIAPKLSAGRVQSVAVRLMAIREWERLDFVSSTYWDLKATLEQDKTAFEAVLTHVGGQRIASGRDFDEKTGKLKPNSQALLLDEEKAGALVERLQSAEWVVHDVEAKERKRRPAPPFITSTLQQEANRKFGMAARQTMRVAQGLYERGLITYMRTDSTTLSSEALKAARSAVDRRYGGNFLSPKPRQYSGKAKNAQEAHEAIRPAGIGMKTARDHGLSGRDGQLYDLIWKRTLASQMANARLLNTTVSILADPDSDAAARFRATGQVVVFPGFLRVYVEGSDDPTQALDDRDRPLPALEKDDHPSVQALEPLGHETKPPPRYTDATLVRTLENEGIGRPSTYASIIDTVVDRGYAVRNRKKLIPTFTGLAVTQLLEENFRRLVDTEFTAWMEKDLDEIAAGDKTVEPYLSSFYLGEDGLEKKVEEGLDSIDPRAISKLTHWKWDPYVIRVGRYGPYVEDPDEKRASIPGEWAPADIANERLGELIEAKGKEDVLGTHPDAQKPVLLKSGPYGPYVQLGEGEGKKKPKRTSVPKGMDPSSVDLDTAVALLNLPRVVGEHPEDGAEVKANIGRYGPYVQHHRTFASLKDEDDVLTVELDRALELLAEKKKKNEPLRTLGEHPESGEPIYVFKGRYGPYAKHKRTNATIPKGVDPKEITLEQAVELIAEKEAKKGKKGRRKKKGKGRR